MSATPSKPAATAQGFGAIGLWAALASLTAVVGSVPPFQLAAMTFFIGTLVGLAFAAATGQSLASLRHVPLGAWVLGVYGLLAYHVCYFFALRTAPPVTANLINYSWPLLIVLLSGLLPAHRGGRGLKWWHIAGALLGFAGTGLILTGTAENVQWTGLPLGYGMAVAAALIWSSYSVLNRFYAGVPSIAVIGSCAATAGGAFVLHLLLEKTHWPDDAVGWAAVCALGSGPVGLAFYLWDAGVKHGDLRLLGAAAYAAPLLSTLMLTVLGLGHANATIWLAALLVTAGALMVSVGRVPPD